MCLHPLIVYQIPEETERVARAAFPKGNLYMRLYGELGAIYSDPVFAKLFPQRGQPAHCPTRLALVLIMQFMENLTDRQAADAVRSRIDWKYLLGLDLTDPGFDFSILSEFRDRLLANEQEHLLLDTLLAHLQEEGLLKTRGRQRTDSTHILAAIHTLNRVELVGRTLQHALNALAKEAPGWLRAHTPPEWFDRYSRLIDEYRLPKEEAKRRLLVEQIGADGLYLLALLDPGHPDAGAPPHLRELEAVLVIRQVWQQQYIITDGRVHLRTITTTTDADKDKDASTSASTSASTAKTTAKTPEQPATRDTADTADTPVTLVTPDMPDTLGTKTPTASERITCPYDTEARYSSKRSVSWVGYKVHLTETCEPDMPHLITHVQTCLATEDDSCALPLIHQDLAAVGRLPGEHLVDTTYASAEVLVSSEQQYGVDVVGPVRPDVSWQALDAQAFDITTFTIDWEGKRAICPQGRISRHWHEERGPSGKPTIQVQFNAADCRACGVRERCTRRKSGARELTLHRQEEHEALERARIRQQTQEFKAVYAGRAGIEGTVSEAVVGHEMRRTRYMGERKTHLQHIVTAVAINLARLFAWWSEKPRTTTRVSPFAALALA